jgi:predicted outer membrane repeat protein
MKTISYLLLLISISISQITINVNDIQYPEGGSYKMYNIPSPQGVIGLTGIQQGPHVFDFSNGVITDTVAIEYVNINDGGHGASFQNATIAERKSTDNNFVWMYLDFNENAGRTNYGFYDEVGVPDSPNVPFNPPIVDFPNNLTYQSYFTGTTNFDVSMSGTEINIDYEFTGFVDAYGTIVLPNGMGEHNCIQVNYEEQYTYNFMGTPIQYSYLRSYYYIAEDLGIVAIIASVEDDAPVPNNFNIANSFARMYESSKFEEEVYEGPVWHIATGGSDETGDGSEINPFASIQFGLNTATEDDTVLVADGIYYENLVWPTVNGIKLIGSNQDDCIIDGNQNESVIRFEGEINYLINTSTLVTDFTIQNGIADFGGGIYCSTSNPNLTSLMIKDNSAACGGGIHCSASSLNLKNVIVTNNSATHYGGGIECEGYVSPIIVNTTIYGNSAGSGGGGIDSYTGSNPRLVNSILWGNTPQQIFLDGGYTPANITMGYSNIQGGADNIGGNPNYYIINWLEGNINSDPLFTNPENGDYTLQSDSPCIDAGTAYFEWEGGVLVDMSEDEYYGSAPDMGAYEYVASDIDDELEITNYQLLNAYPNPFNPVTVIGYELMINSKVDLSIYNINGQLIETLVNGKMQLGYHEVTWDATDQSTGIYFVKMVAGDFVKTQKLMLLK